MSKNVTANDVGLILLARLMKTNELHYGYWPDGMEVRLGNLVEAQARYTEHLLGLIPEGVQRVLDVGCGTGHLMSLLLEKGYQVEGLTPSPMLSQMARDRVGKSAKVHQTFYDDNLKLDSRFDLIIFSESYQYIPLKATFTKSLELLNPGGHLLICDFFRTERKGFSPLGGGHRMTRFQEELAQQPFTLKIDEDITAQTAPNIDVADQLLREYIQPVWDAFGYYFRENYPRFSWLFRKLFNKRLIKLEKKFFTGQMTGDSFTKFKTYHTILLKRDS